MGHFLCTLLFAGWGAVIAWIALLLWEHAANERRAGYPHWAYRFGCACALIVAALSVRAI